MTSPERAAFALGVVLAGAASVAAACASRAPRTRITIPFELASSRLAGGRIPACAENPGGAESTATSLELQDLRLFVHDVGLVTTEGRLVRASLVPDHRFQTDQVALLDFENGLGSCAGGTRATHRALRAEVPRGHYRELRFSVGVPFQANHANPATAEAPLTAGTLSWGWRGGYKFLRLEARLGAATERLHLGSTGCAGTIAHITGCARANRPRVSLAGFRVGRRVAIDLDALIGSRPRGAEDAGSDCMAGADESGCAGYFHALGLGLERGEAHGDQHVFGWAVP